MPNLNKCTGTPSTCTGTCYTKRDSGQDVPVHLQHVPVHVTQKGAVAKMYRYTTNMYRYMRAGLGQKGFLIPFFLHLLTFPTPLHSLQRKTLVFFFPSHTSNPELTVSARVSIAQARILQYSSYERGKPPATP